MLFLTKHESNLHGFCRLLISMEGLILKYCKPLWGELKIYGGVIFITTISLFYFFRNWKHPENWSVSFKNFFRKCECIRCYLRISSNLPKKYFRKTSLFVLTVTGVMEESVLLAAISNYYCNGCDQIPWKNICEENQF